jgi:hypothetical protein
MPEEMPQNFRKIYCKALHLPLQGKQIKAPKANQDSQQDKKRSKASK